MRHRMKPGDRLTYNGRTVEVLDIAKARAPSGSMVEYVRVRDPRRGVRAMFRTDLEAGLDRRRPEEF